MMSQMFLMKTMIKFATLAYKIYKICICITFFFASFDFLVHFFDFPNRKTTNREHKNEALKEYLNNDDHFKKREKNVLFVNGN